MNLAIIPARKNSKGIVDKNIIPLCGKPLIYHTIDAALACDFFDRIVVTTDSLKISTLAEVRCGVMIRPNSLGVDDVPLAPVILHALEVCEKRYQKRFTNIFTLQPTSPLRTAEHIREAYDVYTKYKVDSLLSVTEHRHSLWGLEDGKVVEIYKPEVNRQAAIPYYLGNGAIFITSRDILLKHKQRVAGKVGIYVMDEKDSVDIHYNEDLRLAEHYLR